MAQNFLDALTGGQFLTPEEISGMETAWPPPAATPPHEADALLRQVFGTPFVFVDPQGMQPFSVPKELPNLDWGVFQSLCRSFASRRHAEIAWETEPVVVLALPLAAEGELSTIALAPFVKRLVHPQEDLGEAARELGADRDQLTAWARRQTPWAPESLLRVSDLVLDRARLRRQIDELHRESDELSDHLATTYEEISLLHRLTQNLRISKNDSDLARLALEWLQEVVPAEGFGILLLPQESEGRDLLEPSGPHLLTQGRFPFDAGEVDRLAEMLEIARASRPVVRNAPPADVISLPHGEVRQLVGVPIAEGENLFGHLLAVNHRTGLEFGSVAGNLMQSVATIIGVHSGNLELYRQQAELLEGVIRALTSAIDAKDEYTCGHSDRVARLSVRLAMEMGLPKSALSEIYLAGLLHDIGKIGVEDSVLRKPGKLSDEEYEHIKRHPSIGHRILCELKKLGDVLPVILHHHEAWDGRGYPQQLASEEIPLLARIVAVADSFDAMASDRPYRTRMPREKIDDIFRSGSGRQWDPAVIEAFFRAREDLQRVADGDNDAFRPELHRH